MTSITTEPPTLRSIPSYGVASSSAGGVASLRRSYSCYNCNNSFHITRTASTASTSPSSFRCPRCHHRHLIPHHTVSPPRSPPSSTTPTRDPDYYPSITSYDYQTSDYSDSDDGYDSETPDFNPLTATLKSFVDTLPVREFPPNPTPSAQSCSICMDDFVVRSDASGTVNELPCKHYFHRDCIVEWLQRSNTCPLCRHKLPSDRSPEEGIDRRTNEFGVGYDSIVVVELASGSGVVTARLREPASRRTRDGGSLYPNAAVSGSDRRDLIAYGGELSGRELDAMRDEDGDTLMTDA